MSCSVFCMSPLQWEARLSEDDSLVVPWRHPPRPPDFLRGLDSVKRTKQSTGRFAWCASLFGPDIQPLPPPTLHTSTASASHPPPLLTFHVTNGAVKAAEMCDKQGSSQAPIYRGGWVLNWRKMKMGFWNQRIEGVQKSSFAMHLVKKKI